MTFLKVTLLAFGALVGSSVISLAQSSTRVDKVIAGFETWADAHDVTDAVITVFYQDKILDTRLLGEASTSVITLASLSKAVTGVCLADLVDKNVLAWDWPISRFFGETLQELGVDNPVAGQLTIGQLVTHASGLAPDGTQQEMPNWIGRKFDRHEDASTTALSRVLAGGPAGFAYNNENYAVLGAVIEKVTKEPYDVYCNREILEPLGVRSAKMGDLWAAFGAWGGWEMRSEDFAKFVIGHLGQGTVYGAAPDQAPIVEINDAIEYGLGTFIRRGQNGSNFWHFGALCFGQELQTGSYFAHWGGDWGVVAGYDKCVDFPAMGDLDKAMVNAVFR